jgi:hypothetical protein
MLKVRHDYWCAYGITGNDHHDRHRVLLGRFTTELDAREAVKGRGFYGIGNGEVERVTRDVIVFESIDEYRATAKQ